MHSLTIFYDIFCMRLSGSRDDINSQFDPVSPTWEDAQTGISRFREDIFVYKQLLLVIEEIISRISLVGGLSHQVLMLNLIRLSYKNCINR